MERSQGGDAHPVRPRSSDCASSLRTTRRRHFPSMDESRTRRLASASTPTGVRADAALASVDGAGGGECRPPPIRRGVCASCGGADACVMSAGVGSPRRDVQITKTVRDRPFAPPPLLGFIRRPAQERFRHRLVSRALFQVGVRVVAFFDRRVLRRGQDATGLPRRLRARSASLSAGMAPRLRGTGGSPCGLRFATGCRRPSPSSLTHGACAAAPSSIASPAGLNRCSADCQCDHWCAAIRKASPFDGIASGVSGSRTRRRRPR